jgi:hypothetical protein
MKVDGFKKAWSTFPHSLQQGTCLATLLKNFFLTFPSFFILPSSLTFPSFPTLFVSIPLPIYHHPARFGVQQSVSEPPLLGVMLRGHFVPGLQKYVAFHNIIQPHLFILFHLLTLYNSSDKINSSRRINAYTEDRESSISPCPPVSYIKFCVLLSMLPAVTETISSRGDTRESRLGNSRSYGAPRSLVRHFFSSDIFSRRIPLLIRYFFSSNTSSHLIHLLISYLFSSYNFSGILLKVSLP